MKMFKTSSAVLLAAALFICSPAAADINYFKVTGATSLTFSIDDSIAPDLNDGISFSYLSVPTAYHGISEDALLAFYVEDTGGGFSFNYDLDLYGAQLFSGTVSSPKFNTGTYQLQDLSGDLNYSLTISHTPPGIPEPAVWAMMLIGFGGIGTAMRRRKIKPAIRFA
jgi:hypothetical protein